MVCFHIDQSSSSSSGLTTWPGSLVSSGEVRDALRLGPDRAEPGLAEVGLLSPPLAVDLGVVDANALSFTPSKEIQSTILSSKST